MADVTRVIQILFEAVDNTSGSLASINQSVGAFAGKLEDTTQPFREFTGAILAADLAVAALGVAMLRWSVDEAAQFDGALREINTLLQLPPEAMDQFGRDIQAYASTSTASFREIEGALYDAISAGVDYEDSLDTLRTAEMLAVAGKASLKESLLLLVPTLNAYGEDMSEAGRYSDVFFEAVRLGVTTVPALSQAMGQLSPIAAAAGVPIETVAAAMATLTSNGLATPQAATALKAALSNIIQPSKEASDAAKELGVEFGESALKTQGLEGVIKTLMTATGGSVTEMGRFFGSVEGLAGVLSLGSGEATKFVGNIEAMRGSTGATQAAFEQMKGSFENVSQTLSNNVTAVLQKIGSEFLPQITTILSEIARIFGAVGAGFDSGKFDEPIAIVRGFLAEIEEAARATAENLPAALAGLDWSRLEDAFGRLSEAFSGLFDGVDITTPEGLRSALQWFIDSSSTLFSATAGIVRGLEPVVDALLKVAEYFADAGNEGAEWVGQIAGYGTSINLFSGAIGSVSGLLSSLGSALELFATGSVIRAVGSLTGPGGLAGSFDLVDEKMGTFGRSLVGLGVFIAAFEVGRIVADMTDLDEKFGAWLLTLKGIPEVIGASDTAIGRSETALAAYGRALGDAEFTMQDFNEAVRDGRLVFDEVTGKWQTAEQRAEALKAKFEETKIKAGELATGFNLLQTETGFLIDKSGNLVQITDDQKTSLQGLAPLYSTIINETYRWKDGVLQIKNEFGGWTNATTEQKSEFDKLGDSYREIFSFRDGTLMVKDAMGQWVIATEEQKKAYWGTVEAVNAVTPAVDKQTEAVKKQAAEQEILNRSTTEYLLGWEKIKSDERVAVYEIRSNVEIAQIEADAERVVAAYDSIARSFENTGEVLGQLFDIWSGVDTIAQRDQLEDWIGREYEIRERLAESQIGLIDAEIRRMNAQTELLARGGMDVRITSDGLEPALESFMFQVIDKVRLAVSGSYEEFLIGCGAGA